MADEIIRELWQIKDDIASEHDYDLKKLVKYLQEKNRVLNHQIVCPKSAGKVAKAFVPADLQGPTQTAMLSAQSG